VGLERAWAAELALREVGMRAGPAGAEHEVDREHVWTVLDGDLRGHTDGEALLFRAGDTLRRQPDTPGQIAAVTDARAIVASPAGPRVTTSEGGSRLIPWAA